MKPILESWRRYLKEEFAEEEKQYFGKSLEIGDQIVQIFQDFLKNTVFPRKPQATIKDVQAYLPFFIEEVEAKTIAKKLGCGQFRCGFDVDAKEIIKVDVTPYGAGKEHNKDDHMMGTMIERSNIFPKAYAHSPDFSWVLLEKVKPFGRADVYTYVSYFPNPVLNARRTSDVTKYSVIISSFLYHAGFVEKAKTRMENNYVGKITVDINNDEDLKLVMDAFRGKNPTYDNVMKAIGQFGIRPEELALRNTGIGLEDNRFVILDSSIDSAILRGFAQKAPEDIPAAGEKTKPL
jgi:hypothetical protein